MTAESNASALPLLRLLPRLSLSLCLCLFLAHAANLSAQQRDDTRRILEQNVERRAADQERSLLADELKADEERPTITVDGRTYTVERNANDVGRALYLSLQHRQWQAARRFLSEYLSLPDRDPMLVHYARGALARVDGRFAEAEREYRALLALQPDFLPGRLELARVLFEDQQDHEAERLFEDIAAAIDAGDPQTAGVRQTIETYRQALAKRRTWTGSFALGPAWSDNVNRTSADHTCLLFFSDGSCFIDRQLPEAIVSTGYDYDAALDKRVPLRGHHGLYLRALLYGTGYRDHDDYNELNLTAQAGYSYRSGRHGIALAPSFDFYALGNDAMFGAAGVHAEWGYTLSPQSLLKLEGDWKDLRYRDADYARYFNGASRAAYATYFRSLGEHWTLFGGIDVVDSAASERINAYLQKGVRLGAVLQMPSGFTGTLLAAYRRRDYGAYSALLEATREDEEQSYTLILKADRFTFAGFTPLLSLRHNRVSSNVGWLYDYEKNAAALKLERTF